MTDRFKNRRFGYLRLGVTVAVLATSLLVADEALAAKTFLIEEATDYTNKNKCDGGDVNTITKSLQKAMTSSGWTGTRWVNATAWPTDYIESCSSRYGSNGTDGTWADTRSINVFAGHGSVHRLYLSSNHRSICSVSLRDNVRLGTMSGGKSAFGMWLACEVLQGSRMGSEQHQWLRQQAGYENIIAIGDNEPRDFFNATSKSTNADAWLNTMASKKRRAIIATTENRTHGSTLESCWSVHNSAKLKGNIFNTPRGGGPACGGNQAAYWFCYERRQK